MSGGSAPARIATVGVYGFTAESFQRALQRADVSLVVDVRQRRGVRGTEYAWANARRLQALLAAAGIRYSHHPELAPTTELRQLQYREDARRGIGKRNRDVLAAEYARRYREEILEPAGVESLLAELPGPSEGGLAALMCVEADPAACHRSLIAARLAGEHAYEVLDLRPG